MEDNNFNQLYIGHCYLLSFAIFRAAL